METVSPHKMVERLAVRLAATLRDPDRHIARNADVYIDHEDAFYFYAAKMYAHEKKASTVALYKAHLKARAALVPGLWELVKHNMDVEILAVEYANVLYRAHLDK